MKNPKIHDFAPPSKYWNYHLAPAKFLRLSTYGTIGTRKIFQVLHSGTHGLQFLTRPLHNIYTRKNPQHGNLLAPRRRGKRMTLWLCGHWLWKHLFFQFFKNNILVYPSSWYLIKFYFTSKFLSLLMVIQWPSCISRLLGVLSCIKASFDQMIL